MASINEFEDLLLQKVVDEMERDDVDLNKIGDMVKWVNELQKVKNQEKMKENELQLQKEKDEKLIEIEREKLEHLKEKDEKLLELERDKLEQSKNKDETNAEIEREKMVNQFDLQQDKQRHEDDLENRREDGFWRRAIVDLGLTIIPMTLSMIVYKSQQKKVMEFEENGRINSTAGRKFFNELKWPFGKR